MIKRQVGRQTYKSGPYHEGIISIFLQQPGIFISGWDKFGFQRIRPLVCLFTQLSAFSGYSFLSGITKLQV